MNTAGKFFRRCTNIIELLSLYHKAGTVEIRDKKIRGFLISKQVKLFYRIKREEIVLLNFFDTRLDPDSKLKRYN